MIYRIRFGAMIETDAVMRPEMAAKLLQGLDGKKGGLFDCIQIRKEEAIYCRLDRKDAVYGLGEQVRGINKRGWIYNSDNSDNPHHHEDSTSLYGSHNFLVIAGEKNYGIFLDYAGKVAFDVGYTEQDMLLIRPEDWNFDLYLFEGDSVKEIVRDFRRMTGRCYIPPKWAFGYGQSRWSYYSADEVRQIVKKHRENNLPLDAVYLDIDYMDNYKDFTVNGEAFPEFAEFVREMKQQHIHLVPIIDAGIKKEDGYSVYEEGKEKGYFCKKEDGSEFVAAVWPGHAVFPDFFHEEAREWFGNQYDYLLKQGIDGFWNDMNEPAIFYSEERLLQVFEKLESFKEKNLGMDDYFGMLDLVNGLSNNREDYESFYHDYRGRKIRHDKVHNLFGAFMTRAASEAFERLQPEKRILMFSRSSATGAHRYGGIWQGDNKSWWSHLRLNIRMCPSLNMCGFLYTGADLGGFGSNTTEDLMLRWMEFGIFTPLMRNHSAAGTRCQEIYQFKNLDAFRNILQFRYRLLPYLYSEFMKAALADEMYFQPLAFEYPEDDMASQVEDQLLVGESLMIAPVCEQNARGRYVYLPEEMKMYRLKQNGELESGILSAGHQYVAAELEELIFFLRKGHALPLAAGGNCVEEVDFDHLTVLTFGDGEISYRYYRDDGESRDYDNPDHISVLHVKGDCEMTAE